MKEDYVKKTAFVTPDGHYDFVKMPSGLVNSGATIVKRRLKLFSNIDNVAFYVDDIIIMQRLKIT